MHVPGPIEAESDKQTVLTEELTRLIIQQSAVRLHRTHYRRVWLSVLLRMFYRTAENIESRQR
jgi:hypothetical protein